MPRETSFTIASLVADRILFILPDDDNFVSGPPAWAYGDHLGVELVHGEPWIRAAQTVIANWAIRYTVSVDGREMRISSITYSGPQQSWLRLFRHEGFGQCRFRVTARLIATVRRAFGMVDRRLAIHPARSQHSATGAR